MAPNTMPVKSDVNFNLAEDNLAEDNSQKTIYQRRIVWRNVILISLLHVGAFYGYYLICTASKPQTIIFAYFFGIFVSIFGITAGAHRLWSHRSFKAKFPLRLIFMIANTIALQNDIYEWCRDHRVHHKFSDTDADPHNSRRGFFFSHMGWLMCNKHPDVKEKGRKVDLTDLLDDPLVRFQRKFYKLLVLLLWFALPTWIPYLLWNESKFNSFFIAVCFRYVYSLHSTWLVNSAAHIYGYKPYDVKIEPSENQFVIVSSLGEGYHNYHHTFPWDYSASEWGWRFNFNFTTLCIDFFAWTGLAYDLKTASREIVKKRRNRCGDGTKVLVEPLLDWLVATLIVTWPLWLSFSIRFFVII